MNATWQLLVATFIDAAEDGVTGTLLLSLPQLSRSQKLPIKLSQGLQKVSLPVMSFTEEDGVKPWWPQGYGKPNLYTVKVTKRQQQTFVMYCIITKAGCLFSNLLQMTFFERSVLAMVIILCSWVRHFTVRVSLFTRVYILNGYWQI